MERCFPPFRLDLRNEQLWREDQPVALRPKTFAVLRYLIERPGQLVTKDALLDAVWAGTVVSDTVLKSCIRELRAALEDDVQTPCFIATAHRRGYRFLPVITSLPQGPGVGGQGSGRGLRHESERLLQLTILTPIPNPQPLSSWGEQQNSYNSAAGGTKPCVASASWSSSPARRGLARRPWSKSFFTV